MDRLCKYIYSKDATVAEDCPGPQTVGGVLAVDVLAETVHHVHRGLTSIQRLHVKPAGLLLQHLWIKLEVDMVNSLKVDPTDLRGGAMLLHKSLCSLQDGHHLRFVLEPLHILVAV